MEGKIILIYGFLILFSLFGCRTPVKLNKDQYLLKKNRITIKQFKGNTFEIQKLKTELSTLYKQKPNRKWLLIIPRENVAAYLDNKKNSKVWFRKTREKIAEPPAIWSKDISDATQKNMYNYLFNKGFFDVKVDYKLKTRRNKALVTYTVIPNKKYIIDNFEIISKDTAIQRVIDQNMQNTFLKKGQPVDNFLLQSEKARITELLNSQGYAEFNSFYIRNLETDTTGQFTKIIMRIENPEQLSEHKKYTINKVNVFTDYNPNILTDYVPDTLNSLNFFGTDSRYYIHNKKISEKILLRPNQLFSKKRLDSTYQLLSSLDYFKFINIETKVDSQGSNLLNHNIYLTPSNKWIFDIGADFNYTTLRSTSVTSLFGVSGFTLLKNRNVFHGAEAFETKLEAGAEINFFQGSFINAANLNYTNSYQLPRMVNLTGTLAFTKFILSPLKINFKNPFARTQLSLGYELVTLSNLFRYNSINAAVSYNIPIDASRSIIIRTTDISYYKPKIFPDFDSILNNNTFLANSFEKERLLTGLILSNIQYISQKRLANNWNQTLIANLETSGIEMSLIDGISYLSNKKYFSASSSLDFSKFIKLELDHRWNYTFKDKNTLVMRLNYGIGVPFGNSGAIPFIRQFFMGGPQSLRAWRLREVGPGSDTLYSSGKNEGNYYSSGDIKFEANIEYRFKIYWRFEGALFTDLGNIWLIPKAYNKNRLGVLNQNFYNQIAAGSGLGLRLDFTYFILRLDYGMKWRNPYPDQEGNYGLYTKNRLNYNRIKENSSLHLALNYPF